MAKTITSFAAREYSNEQLFQLTGQLNSLFDSGLPADAGTTRDILGDFGVQVNFVGAILAREKKSEYTRLKNEQDDLRDQIFSALNGRVRSTTNSPMPGEADAAKLLVAEIDKRPTGFSELSFEENTTELDLLFLDLDTAESQAALTTLGLVSWYDALKQANVDFKAIVEQATVAESQEEDLPSLRQTKQILGEKLRLILGILDHFAGKNVAPYVDLMEQAYDRIVAVRAVARARATREGETEGPADPSVA